MKRKFVCIGILAALALGCKKENKPAPWVVTGKWSLTALSQGNLSVNSGQFPCLSQNVLTINTDGTASGTYSGSAACVVPASGSAGAQTTIGQPGQAVVSVKWVANGNQFTFTQPGSQGSTVRYYGTVSEQNNQLVLHITDTVSVAGTLVISQETRVKQ